MEVKRRRRSWAGDVVRMEVRISYRVSERKPEGKEHYENLGVDGNIILYEDVNLIQLSHDRFLVKRQ